MVAILVTAIRTDRCSRAAVVLAYLRLVLRDVEAGCVGQVEGVEFKLRLNLLGNPKALAQ